MTITLESSGNFPGPFQNYVYGAFIKTPTELGMKQNVSGMGIDTIGDNFGALISYITLLVSGTSKASKARSIDSYNYLTAKTGQPLGNAYFFNTGFKCTDKDGVLQDAHAYMNNVPLGNIPFISSVLGAGDMQSLRGILPGMFEDLNGFNPMIIVDALDICNGMPCNYNVAYDEKYRLPITNISADGKSYIIGKEPVEFINQYMVDPLIETIDPCLFYGVSDGSSKTSDNPVSNKTCNQTIPESFTNINNINNINNKLKKDIDDNLNILNNLTKNDWIIQLYYISVSILIIFILIKILNKSITHH